MKVLTVIAFKAILILYSIRIFEVIVSVKTETSLTRMAALARKAPENLDLNLIAASKGRLRIGSTLKSRNQRKITMTEMRNEEALRLVAAEETFQRHASANLCAILQCVNEFDL